MRLVLLSLLVMAPAFAGKSVVTSTVPATALFPNAAPYNAVKDLRMEIRLTHLRPCANVPAINNGHNIARVMNSFGGAPLSLGCLVAGEKSLASYTTTPVTFATQAELGSADDVILRLQRTGGPTGYYRAEVWSSDGGARLAGKEYSVGNVSVPYALASTQGYILAGLSGNGTANVAWMRVYTTSVPLNSSVPADNATCLPTEGCIAKWDFESTLTGKGYNGITLNLTKADATYVDSPSHTPIVQFDCSPSPAVAASPVKCTDSSFSFDDVGIKSRIWNWSAGPARPTLTDVRSPAMTMTDLVEGSHDIRLTVTDASGQVINKQQTLTVLNRDVDDIPLYPVAAHSLSGNAAVGFRLADVPGAVDVEVTVRKPDGRLLAPTVCASSPCTVPVDTRQKDHTFRLAYRNSSGKVLSRSTEWAQVPVAQQATPWIGNDGEFGSFGTYLSQNTIGKPGYDSENSRLSARFFSRRLTMSLGGRSPYQFNPKMPISAYYIDGIGVYPPHASEVNRFLRDDRGEDHEKHYLHLKENWSAKGDPSVVPSGIGWWRMDKFDAFDETQGVLVYNSSTDTQVSNITGSIYAYPGTYGSSVTATAYTLNASANRIYLGYTEPWDEVTFDLKNAPSGCTVTWEYPTGKTSWATQPQQSDGTSGLTGGGTIRFAVPGDWKLQSLAGGDNKWWRRVTLTGCSSWPTIASIKGDALDTGILNNAVLSQVTTGHTDTTAGTHDCMPVAESASPTPGACTDRSIAMHPTYGADSPVTLTENSRLIIGARIPFNEVRASIGSAPSGCSITWEYVFEYWDHDGNPGTATVPHWTTISPVTDTTNGLTQNGVLTFTPPGDWTPARMNYMPAAMNQYWLRANVNGCSVWPTLTTAYAAKNGTFVAPKGYPVYRGWCATDDDGSRENAGTPLEYDPTPPKTCSARFPWHARMLGNWKANLQLCNYGAQADNGDFLCARRIAEVAKHVPMQPVETGVPDTVSGYYNGLFLDDLYELNTNVYAHPLNRAVNQDFLAYTELGPVSRTDYIQLMKDHMAHIKRYMREEHPDAIVGPNSNLKELYLAGDGYLVELGSNPFGSIRQPQYYPGNDSFIYFDNWRPAVNPGCATKVLFAANDHLNVLVSGSTLATSMPQFYFWDRANRGPMTTLAAYYIYANECASLFYTTGSASFYSGADDYYYWEEAPTGVLTAAIELDLTAYPSCDTGRVLNGDWAALPTGVNTIRLGKNGQFLQVTKSAAGTVRYCGASRVYEDVAAGEPWYLIKRGFLSRQAPPPVDRIYMWGNWFPAQEVRIGVPDTVNGIVGDTIDGVAARGNRVVRWVNASTHGWLTPAQAGTRHGVMRRDFTKAVALYAPASLWIGNGQPTRSQMETYGSAIEFSDPAKEFSQQVYYPLRADGKTDNSACNYTSIGGSDYRTEDGGCSAVRLRSGEGMVLMKQPVP